MLLGATTSWALLLLMAVGALAVGGGSLWFLFWYLNRGVSPRERRERRDDRPARPDEP